MVKPVIEDELMETDEAGYPSQVNYSFTSSGPSHRDSPAGARKHAGYKGKDGFADGQARRMANSNFFGGHEYDDDLDETDMALS
jgi:hypothetical protein